MSISTARFSRRQFLGGAGTAAAPAALGLAGCGGSTSSTAATEAATTTAITDSGNGDDYDGSPEADPSGFVLLADAAPDVIQEIRYYTTFNFVGDRIDGYEEPVALITKEAGEALAQASDYAITRGYRLKIYDAYRPQMAVDHFVRWAEDLDDARMKEWFYPELDKSVLFDQGYIAEKSGHTRGSTVDLTLFDLTTGHDAEMGGTFDYFGELSHPDYVGNLTADALANRAMLAEIMTSAGFKPLDTEWWHFTLADEPYPDTYFTFPVSRETVASA